MSAVARARTLTLLSRLGGGRKKRSVLEFLWEARLIDRERTVRDESNLIERWHNIASLVNADLSGADLSVSAVDPRIWPGADLRQADLSGAKLSGANLSGAILVEAKGWTEEQLLVANSLERTTMPDGQVLRSDVNPKGPTFEDWLKSSSRGEDGENSGPS